MSNRQCFWFDETHKTPEGFEVNLVTENEAGYNRTPLVLPFTEVAHAKAHLSVLNQRIFNLSPDDTSVIVLSSMFPALPTPVPVCGDTVTVEVKIKVSAKVDEWGDEYGMTADEARADVPGHVKDLVEDALAVHPWFKNYTGSLVKVEVTR